MSLDPPPSDLPTPFFHLTFLCGGLLWHGVIRTDWGARFPCRPVCEGRHTAALLRLLRLRSELPLQPIRFVLQIPDLTFNLLQLDPVHRTLLVALFVAVHVHPHKQTDDHDRPEQRRHHNSNGKVVVILHLLVGLLLQRQHNREPRHAVVRRERRRVRLPALPARGQHGDLRRVHRKGVPPRLTLATQAHRARSVGHVHLDHDELAGHALPRRAVAEHVFHDTALGVVLRHDRVRSRHAPAAAGLQVAAPREGPPRAFAGPAHHDFDAVVVADLDAKDCLAHAERCACNLLRVGCTARKQNSSCAERDPGSHRRTHRPPPGGE
eukprot:Rhum_TRINITY_DN9740_c0_g2::Rhum_TRINITY_DN9740_c0_g2_i1::g.34792::m.34792